MITAVGLITLMAFGAIIRAKGFTSFDLWFDDAWAAAPARVSLSKAIHMVLTAPGYSLALREWIRADPVTTWWAQIPAFVLGVVAIPVAYLTARALQCARWSAAAVAVVVAVCPILVQYSTRVKEYPFDLLAACLLLVLAERARRAPTTRRLAWVAVASVATFFCSAGATPVMVGAWLALLVSGVARRATRRRALGWACGAAAGCAVVWALLLRTLPSVLNINWRRRGFLVDYRSLPRFERSVTIIAGGFIHGLFGYPVPWAFFHGRLGLHCVSAAAIGAVVLAVAVAVPVAQSWRRREVTAALAASLSVAVAIVLAAADKVPFGDGRTDEALYPAVLVCLVVAAELVVPWAARSLPRAVPRVAVAGALCAALVAGALTFGASHEATYPTISLRGLYQRLKPLLRPGEVVFVDTFNSFGWCYYQLTPCRFEVGGTPMWPQNFKPVAINNHHSAKHRAKPPLPPTVFIAMHYGIPLPELTAAQANATAIWYVGFTYGTYDVGAPQSLWNFPVKTYMTGLLHNDGWRAAIPTPTTQILGLHTYAILMVRPKR